MTEDAFGSAFERPPSERLAPDPRVGPTWDLALALGAVAVAVAMSELAPRAVGMRGPVGAAAVLVAPGYLLTAALYPQRFAISGAWRTMLSIALSLSTVGLLALLLDVLPGGVNQTSLETALTVVAAGLWWTARSRRRRMSEALPVRLGRAWNWATVLAAAGAAVLFVAAGTVAWRAAGPIESGGHFTAFYLADVRQLQVPGFAPVSGDSVLVSVENHEGRIMHYLARAVGGAATGPAVRMTVPAGSRRSKWISLPSAPGTAREMRLELFVNGQMRPYRSLSYRGRPGDAPSSVSAPQQ